MQKEIILSLGGISSGTLQCIHVIPRLANFLRDTWTEYYDARVNDTDATVISVASNASDDWHLRHALRERRIHWDAASDAWENLADRITAICPDCIYCGAHPGDDADIGVWRIDDKDFENENLENTCDSGRLTVLVTYNDLYDIRAVDIKEDCP